MSDILYVALILNDDTLPPQVDVRNEGDLCGDRGNGGCEVFLPSGLQTPGSLTTASTGTCATPPVFCQLFCVKVFSWTFKYRMLVCSVLVVTYISYVYMLRLSVLHTNVTYLKGIV